MSDGAAWPYSEGEIPDLIRSTNWASTPLGPVKSWSHRLKAAVEMLLPNGFPMIVLWGPELIQIYNDGYRDLMGPKHPGGFARSNSECWPEVWHINEPIYERVFQGETVTFEDAFYPLVRSGKSEDVWLNISYSPVRDDDGSIGGVLVAMYETTGRVLAERSRDEHASRLEASAGRMEILVAELQHRTRNMLTIVHGLFEQTASASDDIADLRSRFLARVGALSRVNGLLSEIEGSERLSFDQLIKTEVAAVAGPDRGSQVRLDGPRGIRLRSSSVQTFALALHELATNAVKHGALSLPEGLLEVTWRSGCPQRGPDWLHVEWRESGVTVRTNSEGSADGRKSGAGRRLIERALPYQLGATVDYQLAPEGLVCQIGLLASHDPVRP